MAGACRERLKWAWQTGAATCRSGTDAKGSPASHAQGVGALGSPSLPWTTGHL